MRKLASIQRVWRLDSIPGADNIEIARVLGWTCVVRKGQFHLMDLAVYFEVDSFLPVRKELEFLRTSSYKRGDGMGEGFKIREMKFKGQVSQGLLLPLSLFPEIPQHPAAGDDVTALLGVRKWEEEEKVTIGGTILGPLPYDVPRADEVRIQAQPELLDEFQGLDYYISTKMNGSTHSVSLDEDGFHVTGHNYEYKNDGKSDFYRFIRKLGLEMKMRDFAYESGIRELTVQGEFCGPGIQHNCLHLTKPEWYVFTVRENGERDGLERMLSACHFLGLQSVPVEEIGNDLPSKYQTIEKLTERAAGKYKSGEKKAGIVIRPVEPVYSELLGGPLSFKVVNNK